MAQIVEQDHDEVRTRRGAAALLRDSFQILPLGGDAVRVVPLIVEDDTAAEE